MLKPANLLWTGGWDSTFQIAKLADSAKKISTTLLYYKSRTTDLSVGNADYG